MEEQEAGSTQSMSKAKLKQLARHLKAAKILLVERDREIMALRRKIERMFKEGYNTNAVLTVEEDDEYDELDRRESVLKSMEGGELLVWLDEQGQVHVRADIKECTPSASDLMQLLKVLVAAWSHQVDAPGEERERHFRGEEAA